uniref:Uncharacterized protein n=1 Tax=Anguilla anguilla TaxID=7936 RepID=A0A0E9QSV2_ANGAN
MTTTISTFTTGSAQNAKGFFFQLVVFDRGKDQCRFLFETRTSGEPGIKPSSH